MEGASTAYRGAVTVTTRPDLPVLGPAVVAGPPAAGTGASPGAGSRRLRDLPGVRALVSQSLTGAGGTLLALLLMSPGVLVDLTTDATVGLPSTLSFLVAVVAAALAVRRKALGTAAVLPPLLYAGAVTTLAWLSGNNEGSRELVLDAGTTLALAAPVLFAGTALALLVVLGRLVWSLVRH